MATYVNVPCRLEAVQLTRNAKAKDLPEWFLQMLVDGLVKKSSAMYEVSVNAKAHLRPIGSWILRDPGGSIMFIDEAAFAFLFRKAQPDET